MEITLSEEEAHEIAQLLHWLEVMAADLAAPKEHLGAAHYEALLRERLTELSPA